MRILKQESTGLQDRDGTIEQYESSDLAMGYLTLSRRQGCSPCLDRRVQDYEIAPEMVFGFVSLTDARII